MQPADNMRRQNRLAYCLIPLLNLLEERGEDTGAFLEAVGIPSFGLVDPSYTITIEREVSIVAAAARMVDMPNFGLELARHTHLHNYSVLGLALKSCETAADVFDVVQRYPELVWGSCNTLQSTERGHLVVEFLCGPSALDTTLMLRDMGCSVVLMKEALGAPFGLKEVRLTLDDAEAVAAGVAEFFPCPVIFGAPHNALVIPDAVRAQRLPGADRFANAFFLAQCDQMTERVRQPFSYSRAVRERLSRNNPVPTLEEVAVMLDLSARMLQRKLRDEDSQFSQLLQESRSKRATDMLREQGRLMESIAEDLGFKDAVAFSHAFKKWFGKSPRQWRQQHCD